MNGCQLFVSCFCRFSSRQFSHTRSPQVPKQRPSDFQHVPNISNTFFEQIQNKFPNLQKRNDSDTSQQKTTQHNTTQHNITQHHTTSHNTTQHTTQHNTTQLQNGRMYNGFALLASKMAECPMDMPPPREGNPKVAKRSMGIAPVCQPTSKW